MTRKKPPEPKVEAAGFTPAAGADEPELKERVIHTRVPESLEAELRRRAQDLGISVSNLVRNVLGHAFGLVGDVVADSHAIARAAKGERAAAPSGEVVAWQPVTLAKNAVCVRCNAVLAKGKAAVLGMTEAGPGPIVCKPCAEGEDT